MENKITNHLLKRLLPLALVIAGFFVNVHSQIAAPIYDTDFQLWNETQIIVPLTKAKDWNFVFSIVGRFGNDVRTTTDARIGGMITKKINKHVTLGGGYLYRYSNPTFVRKRYESRYIGSATFTFPLCGKFTFMARPQVQYEDRYSRPNAVVIEPRFTIKREVTLAKKKFEPFVSFEPFYDFMQKIFVSYREQVGISHKFNKNITADIYYIRQDVPGDGTRPGKFNGIGTNLKVTVR